jgi:drug/metabolite transporter (DMT)-like permease
MYLEGYMTIVLAYAAIYLIWGSTYLAIRVAVGAIPPLLLMGVRCLTAGTLLLAWAAVRGERADVRQWRHAAVAGALMIACTYGALGWAEQRLGSGVAALLSATSPLWLTTLEWPRRGRPAVTTIVGLLLGVAGVAFLVVRGPAGQVNMTAAIVLIAGTLTWAAGSLYSRPPRLPASVALGAGMPLLLGGAMLLVASIAVGEPARYVARDVSRASLWALAYLIVFGSLVGFTAYSWLLRVAPASRVGTHAYVNPLVAVALGWGMAGEPVTATTGVAAAAIAASVAMVLKGAH